jgi:hypothetical protein
VKKNPNYFLIIKESLTRLKNGFEKLTESNDLIVIMKEELVALGPQIELKEKVIILLSFFLDIYFNNLH